MIYESLRTNIEKMVNGDKEVTSRPISVGKPSRMLSECGARSNNEITITKKVIDKSLRQEKRDDEGRLIGNTGHGLTVEQIIQSIQELESPALIFQGTQEKSLLVVTSIRDIKMRNIVVAIELDRQEGFSEVNSIRSLYGRDNFSFFISDRIDSGKLLAVNKEKADDLLRSIGKSYPKENTFISFN